VLAQGGYHEMHKPGRLMGGTTTRAHRLGPASIVKGHEAIPTMLTVAMIVRRRETQRLEDEPQVAQRRWLERGPRQYVTTGPSPAKT